MQIRPAAARDADFLTTMLLEAFDWAGRRPLDRRRIARDPAMARYVRDWPREGDFGVVAEDEAGVRTGAAWARLFPADDPGYGFVAPDVPELALAVAREYRGRGVGRALLAALLAQAAVARVPGLSLSVEDGNGAVRLYRQLGFTAVGRTGGSDTMARMLQ